MTDEQGASGEAAGAASKSTNHREPTDHQAPAGARSEHSFAHDGGTLGYEAVADWIILRKQDQPVAEMFHVAYLARDEGGDGGDASRPLTFVFNGGPGAASAYLHVGALGPRRVLFNADGTTPPPPARLVDNAESWLTFTDLVFIDPVGTGFSRVIDKGQGGGGKGAPAGGGLSGGTWMGGGGGDQPAAGNRPGAEPREFWKIERDLEFLGEFVQRFLSRHGRWGSPIFIAGESYGGFRAARLARKLQEGFGVGLSGAILISPALELFLLGPSDYDVLPWLGTFPSLVAAAHHHGRASTFAPGTALPDVLAHAERFAVEKLAPLLILGEETPAATRDATLDEMSALVGLERGLLERCAGRLDKQVFVRELLRDQGLVCGLYDAAITGVDPFPGRSAFAGPDPTLFAIERLFTGGINTHLRQDLQLQTERDYHLLNFEVNASWQQDDKKHFSQRHIGSIDDLRYGMALNPHMRVWITHGYYDLVTPYYASNRLTRLLRLSPTQRANLLVEHFDGGHMFYAWEDSRRAFANRAQAFYAEALQPS